MKISQLYRFASAICLPLERVQPVWWLVVRLWIAMIFFKSGLVKFWDFETTVALFTDEYQVPFLPPYCAALSGTCFELACPVLLVLGLATRLAALPLLVMTMVIQFTYLDHMQHYYWMLLLSGLILHGGDKLSLDYALTSRGKKIFK